MKEAVLMILGALFLAAITGSEFASFQQGRQDYYDQRVERLKLRQKRRLLKRGK